VLGAAPSWLQVAVPGVQSLPSPLAVSHGRTSAQVGMPVRMSTSSVNWIPVAPMR
jgi:hypothetical protein